LLFFQKILQQTSDYSGSPDGGIPLSAHPVRTEYNPDAKSPRTNFFPVQDVTTTAAFLL
jgi:hypothetical protein